MKLTKSLRQPKNNKKPRSQFSMLIGWDHNNCSKHSNPDILYGGHDISRLISRHAVTPGVKTP